MCQEIANKSSSLVESVCLQAKSLVDVIPCESQKAKLIDNAVNKLPAAWVFNGTITFKSERSIAFTGAWLAMARPYLNEMTCVIFEPRNLQYADTKISDKQRPDGLNRV